MVTPSSFRMVHSEQLSAPADEVYRIINAVDEWSKFFPPCRNARVVWAEGADVLIEVTADVGGQLRTWRSRRVRHPEQYLVEFEQVDPFPPVSSMKGAWRVVPREDGTCEVYLEHVFEATATSAARGEPARSLDEALDWIRSVCDNNSKSELEAFKAYCEQPSHNRQSVQAQSL